MDSPLTIVIIGFVVFVVVLAVLNKVFADKNPLFEHAEMAALDITGDAFHPEWNYTIKPRQPLNE